MLGRALLVCSFSLACFLAGSQFARHRDESILSGFLKDAFSVSEILLDGVNIDEFSTSLALAIGTGMDNFAVGAAYGCRGRRVPQVFRV